MIPGLQTPPETTPLTPPHLLRDEFEKERFCLVGQCRTKNAKKQETEIGQLVTDGIVWRNC